MSNDRLELESGNWNWKLVDLKARSEPQSGTLRGAETIDADPDPGRKMLLLEDDEHAGDWMSREVPPDVSADDISQEQLLEIAREPGERHLTDAEGKVWTIEPVPRPEAGKTEAEFDRPRKKVQVSSGGGPARLLTLPEGTMLGTISRDELLELIGT